MNKKIDTGICPVTGYEKQSLKCANCRNNRVDNPIKFLACQKTECKTLGTVCIATEADEKKTKGNAKPVTKR
jgi:hypothetical protein